MPLLDRLDAGEILGGDVRVESLLIPPMLHQEHPVGILHRPEVLVTQAAVLRAHRIEQTLGDDILDERLGGAVASLIEHIDNHGHADRDAILWRL